MNLKATHIFFWLLCFICLNILGQKKKSYLSNPTKYGVLYSHGNENNFLFNDVDYNYKSNTLKFQAFYDLGKWKSLDFEWIVQPQIQFLKHQLLNAQFVLPTEDNYEIKRAEFTESKSMYLYAFELGFVVRKTISKNFSFQGIIGLGVATIDKRSERLAKGFTFIENATIGVLYTISPSSIVHLGCVAGHVSNFDTQIPNSGYNTLGFEIGYQIQIK